MRLAVTDVSELLIRILDNRRAFVRIYRRDLLHHARDLDRVVNDDLTRLCRAQVREFFQHFLCCPQIEGRLGIRIVKPFAGHDNTAVHFIFRVKEMHVAGGDHGFPEFFSQFHDLPVDIPEILVRSYIRRAVALDHEAVVPQRLYLIVIIEIRQPGDLLGRALLQHCLVQFARLAGAADQEPFPVFIEQALRNPGPP